MPRRKRRRLRLMSRRTRRTGAMRLATLVVLLHCVLLVALECTAGWDPPRVALIELFWAALRRPSFYILVGVGVSTPVLSLMSLSVRGRHRWALLFSWATLIFILAWRFPRRIEAMVNVLQWYLSN